MLENQKMCNKAVDNYTHTLKFVSVCYKTQKMYNKAVDTSPSAIQFLNAVRLNKLFIKLFIFAISI